MMYMMMMMIMMMMMMMMARMHHGCKLQGTAGDTFYIISEGDVKVTSSSLSPSSVSKTIFPRESYLYLTQKGEKENVRWPRKQRTRTPRSGHSPRETISANRWIYTLGDCETKGGWWQKDLSCLSWGDAKSGRYSCVILSKAVLIFGPLTDRNRNHEHCAVRSVLSTQ